MLPSVLQRPRKSCSFAGEVVLVDAELDGHDGGQRPQVGSRLPTLLQAGPVVAQVGVLEHVLQGQHRHLQAVVVPFPVGDVAGVVEGGVVRTICTRLLLIHFFLLVPESGDDDSDENDDTGDDDDDDDESDLREFNIM